MLITPVTVSPPAKLKLYALADVPVPKFNVSEVYALSVPFVLVPAVATVSASLPRATLFATFVTAL